MPPFICIPKSNGDAAACCVPGVSVPAKRRHGVNSVNARAMSCRRRVNYFVCRGHLVWLTNARGLLRSSLGAMTRGEWLRTNTSGGACSRRSGNQCRRPPIAGRYSQTTPKGHKIPEGHGDSIERRSCFADRKGKGRTLTSAASKAENLESTSAAVVRVQRRPL